MDILNNTNEYLELVEKYKLLAENTVECIWLFDLANGCFKYISPSITNLRGLTVEEAMKERLEDSLTPESLKKIRSQRFTRLTQFLAGDRSDNIASNIDEYEQYCKDGTIKTIEISTKLIFNKETNSVDVLGVSRDVSYRKKSSPNVDNVLKNTFDNVHKLFGIDNGRIYCFGKLLVYGNSSNTPIKWRTSKSEELFAYLLQNLEQGTPKWKIFEALWPECDSGKINNYLHTSLYKMKQALNSADIKFDVKFINGCYWMSLQDVYIDTIEFDSILSSNMLITSDTIENYEKVFSLYKNHYLDDNDFVWSLSKKESYSIKYFKLAEAIINYYMEIHSYDDTERIINNILEKYPLNEFTNEMCLKLSYIKKDRVAFINHYNSMQKLFKTELGIDINDSMKDLYDTFINREYT